MYKSRNNCWASLGVAQKSPPTPLQNVKLFYKVSMCPLQTKTSPAALPLLQHWLWSLFLVGALLVHCSTVSCSFHSYCSKEHWCQASLYLVGCFYWGATFGDAGKLPLVTLGEDIWDVEIEQGLVTCKASAVPNYSLFTTRWSPYSMLLCHLYPFVDEGLSLSLFISY